MPDATYLFTVNLRDRSSDMLVKHIDILRGAVREVRGVIPCYIGDRHPLLERLTGPIPELAATYWMIVTAICAAPACARLSTG